MEVWSDAPDLLFTIAIVKGACSRVRVSLSEKAVAEEKRCSLLVQPSFLTVVCREVHLWML